MIQLFYDADRFKGIKEIQAIKKAKNKLIPFMINLLNLFLCAFFHSRLQLAHWETLFANLVSEFFPRSFRSWSEVWTATSQTRDKEFVLDSVKLSLQPAKNR